MIEPTYLGEIPLDEETLAHYGVKGMRWGHRRGRGKKDALQRGKKKVGATKAKTINSGTARAARHARNWYQHVADEVDDGRFRDRDNRPDDKYGYYEYVRTTPTYNRANNPNMSSRSTTAYDVHGDAVEKALESRQRRRRRAKN